MCTKIKFLAAILHYEMLVEVSLSSLHTYALAVEAIGASVDNSADKSVVLLMRITLGLKATPHSKLYSQLAS